MSGGYFNYKQLYIADIEEEIEKLLESEDFINSLSKKNKEKVLEELSCAITSISISRKYIELIDNFISGTDSETNFLKKIQKDINSL